MIPLKRNDKLFRSIDKRSLRTDQIRGRRVSCLVPSECDFSYNITAIKYHSFTSHMFGEYMLSGWIMDSHLSIQWMRMGLERYLWTNLVNGTQHIRRCESALHSEVRTLIWAAKSFNLSKFGNGLQRRSLW